MAIYSSQHQPCRPEEDDPPIFVASQSHRPPPTEFRNVFQQLAEHAPKWRLQWELFAKAMIEAEVFSFGHLHDNKLVSESFRGSEFYAADHLRLPFRSVVYWYDVTLDQERMKLASERLRNAPPGPAPTQRYVTIALDTDAWGATPKGSRGILACDWLDADTEDLLSEYARRPREARSMFLLASAGYFAVQPGDARWHGNLIAPLRLPSKDLEADALGALGDGVIGLSMILCTRGIGLRVEEASAKLNAKRARSGKDPLPRVTHVDAEMYYRAMENTASGGSHASPVPHLRRGHIRRYADGNSTWIRDCLVNCRTATEASKRDHYEIERP